jgi:hypothetical protein
LPWNDDFGQQNTEADGHAKWIMADDFFVIALGIPT